MILNALGGPVKIEKFVPHVTITAETGVVTYPEKSYFYQGLTVDPVPQSLLDEAYQNGYDVGYVEGVESVPEGVDLSLFGCTKYAVDTFTVTSNTYSINITHSLGEVPKLALIIASKKVNGPSSSQRAVYRALMSALDGTEKAGWVASGIDSSGNHQLFTYGANSGSYFDAKATHLQWWGSSGGYYAYFMTGVEYKLITMA